MTLEAFGIINGLSGLAIFLVGLICCLDFLRKYVISRKRRVLLTGLAMFGMGGSWFGVSIAFLTALQDNPISQRNYILLMSWAPALAGTLWVFLGFLIIKPKYKFHALAVMLVVSIFYLVQMYLLFPFADKTVEGDTIRFEDFAEVGEHGGLPDMSYEGLVQILVAFYIAILLLFVGPMFLYTSFTAEKEETRVRSRIIGLGMVIFSLGAFVDGLLASELPILFISRLMVLIGISLTYMGYTAVWQRFFS
ncbi:MAG: hypothetical protein ACFFCQ_11080 [Promethearchaeota archaeon]